MEVTRNNEIIDLAPMEYKLLVYLILNKGQVLTREQIIIKLLGYDFEGNERALDTHIKKLRKALGKSGQFIVTCRKVGYRWLEE